MKEAWTVDWTAASMVRATDVLTAGMMAVLMGY